MKQTPNMKQTPKWLILTILTIAQFMVVLDLSVVNVALPALRQALHFSTANLQWVVTAYALTFGGFLLLGGRAADLFGRKKTLLIGMSAFTVISLFIGMTRSAGMLIALRALQGLAAAHMSPSALSTLLVTFRDGKERNTALGIWTSVAAGGAAVGLLLGGILTQYVGWRWNFFINVPVGTLVALAVARYIPVHEKEERHHTLDLPGAILVTSGLMSLVYAISQAPSWGWINAKTFGITAIAAALLGAFVWNESKSEHPLLPLSIFRVRNVVGANLMMAPVYAGSLGMFFLASLYIQTVLHYSPVKTGIGFIIFPIIIGNVAPRVSKLVSRFGYRRFLVIGPAIMAAGMLWLSRLPVHGSYITDLLPAFILIPLGMGMSMVSTTIAATSGVAAHESGLASGLISTSQQMGGALGLAVLSGVAASVTKTALRPNSLSAVVHGYDHAFIAAAIFLAFAVVLAVTVVKQITRPAQAHPVVVEA